MTPKPNQGMQRPSLGGIGSRFDVPTLQQVCNHEKPWRLDAASKIICGVCHPPAVAQFEWIEIAA